MSSVSFGNVTVGGSSAAKTFTIKNTGTAMLTGIAVTTDGAEFTVLSRNGDWIFGHFEGIGDGWLRREHTVL